jgi:DNA oxidative demethylase
MSTPGGGRMSVAMTNCGRFGWISDHSGYRYSECDPLTGGPWPPIPSAFATLAQNAATIAGFHGFAPDACLINRYVPGSRLALHQDRDEQDFSAPIVSVSLGAPAVFLFGGSRRRDKPTRYELLDGDVVVWGGPARLRYHGIAKLPCGSTSVPGAVRYNLTLRKAA